MFDGVDSVRVKYLIITLFSLLAVITCLVCYLLLKSNNTNDINEMKRNQEALNLMMTTVINQSMELKQSQDVGNKNVEDGEQIKMMLLPELSNLKDLTSVNSVLRNNNNMEALRKLQNYPLNTELERLSEASKEVSKVKDNVDNIKSELKGVHSRTASPEARLTMRWVLDDKVQDIRSDLVTLYQELYDGNTREAYGDLKDGHKTVLIMCEVGRTTANRYSIDVDFSEVDHLSRELNELLDVHDVSYPGPEYVKEQAMIRVNNIQM